MVRNFLKGVGQVVAVGLPSIFILFWTIDASLVPGADVFFITLVQFIFIIVFVAWVRRSFPKSESESEAELESDAHTAPDV